MKKVTKNRIIACFLMLVTLSLSCTSTANAKWDVTPSTVNYQVDMNEAYCVYIYNEKSIGSKVGTEYYLTYTVDRMTIEKHSQQGVVGTNVPEEFYPYQSAKEGCGGLYRFSADGGNPLLVEGRTYFFKFTITEEGYDYRIAWGEEDDSSYLTLKNTYGEVKTNLGYFGVFLADVGMTGKLSKVRFYDKNGNDLGVGVTARDNKAVAGREDPWPKNTSLKHSYDITVSNQKFIGISNLRVPSGDKVYMEYTVESTKDAYMYTRGVSSNNSPKSNYVYDSGILLYEQFEQDITKLDEGPLLTVGAEYLYIFEKKADKLNVIIQKTYKGETSYISFPGKHGTFYEDLSFYSIWHIGVPSHPFSFKLVDFKCYDDSGKNLGVQCNQTAEIIHYGEHEDYERCEAFYYNKADGTYYALYKDKSLKFFNEGKVSEGTYKIQNQILSVKTQEGTQKYDFMYRYFTDSEGNEWQRLHKYKIIFETGRGSAVDTQTISAKTGYQVVLPDEPTLKGNTFVGWYTLEGEEYDFDKIVTESVTLYAKWSEEEEYTSILSGNKVKTSANLIPYIVFGAGTLILIAAVVYCTILMMKGRNNGKCNKKEKTHE